MLEKSYSDGKKLKPQILEKKRESPTSLRLPHCGIIYHCNNYCVNFYLGCVGKACFDIDIVGNIHALSPSFSVVDSNTTK